MSSSPARRWFRRTGALIAGAPLLAGLLQLPAAHEAHSAGQSSLTEATRSNTVDVSLNSLSPSVPTDGGTLTISGTVRNNGQQTVTSAHVDLRVGGTMSGRTEIDDAAKRTGFDQYADERELGGKHVETFSRLAPGLAQPFSISVPVKELDLGADGVYQLGVSLSGRTAAAPYDQVLGIQRTFLPWQPDTADTRTKNTYLWPLISTTHLTAETGPGEQQQPVFKNAELAEEISPGGRLERMLNLGKNLDITWVIDPDLLASVDAMTRSYEVKAGSGTTIAAGKNQAVAKQWLAELEQAVQGEEVVALPFADPDLASLAHNGKNVTGSLSHLKDATDVAAGTVETVLHVEPETDFSWPVNGAVDPSIVKVATSAGADKVIARSDSLKETGGLPYTPNAARPIGGGITAVVADARLSTAFQGDMAKADASTLAVQKFLAQSLMTTLQAPAKQRSVVIAPQRMPSVSQAQTMAQALTALQSGTWSQSQTLSAAADAKPDPGATTQIPSAYPSSLRKQELPTPAFEDIQTAQTVLDRFKVILTDQSRVVTPFGRAMNREMSTSWRGHTTEAEAYRNSVQSYLDTLTAQVRLIKKSETKLSGRSATIPVTVQNNLVQGVDKLVLRLTSLQPKRLEIDGEEYTEQIIQVSGGHSQSVKFDTNANANGEVAVVARLYTEDGQRYGEAVTFDVNVTEFTPTVMLVIAGGMLLLVLAGFRMYTQRKRAAAQQPEEETAAGETSDDGVLAADESGEESGPRSGADEPEHQSDPTPDTGQESTDPSGTGERVDR